MSDVNFNKHNTMVQDHGYTFFCFLNCYRTVDGKTLRHIKSVYKINKAVEQYHMLTKRTFTVS
uniref:Uncharacterized protein n=1 Tax=Arundo donax TaxID=35708 RepID=A0A0A8Z0L3_ARUDO